MCTRVYLGNPDPERYFYKIENGLEILIPKIPRESYSKIQELINRIEAHLDNSEVQKLKDRKRKQQLLLMSEGC